MGKIYHQANYNSSHLIFDFGLCILDCGINFATPFSFRVLRVFRGSLSAGKPNHETHERHEPRKSWKRADGYRQWGFCERGFGGFGGL